MSGHGVGAAQSSPLKIEGEHEFAAPAEAPHAPSISSSPTMPLALLAPLQPRSLHSAIEGEAVEPLDSGARGSRPPLQQLGPEALETARRLLHARAAASESESASAPWQSRLAGAITRRPLAVAAVLPGTGRAVNRPVRSEVPARATSGEPDPILQQAYELIRIAQSMSASLQRAEVSLWQRPAPSTARRRVSHAIPWLKPAPLHHLASFADSSSPSATARKDAPVTSASREDIARGAAAMLAQVEQRRQWLDQAVIELPQARAQCERALNAVEALRLRRPPPVAGAPYTPLQLAQAQLTQAQTRMRRAGGLLHAAKESLHQLIHSTDLLALIGLSEISDQADRSLAFSLQRLADLKAHTELLLGQTGARRAAIEVELAAHAETNHTLLSLDHDLLYAEQTATHAEARLERLSAELAALPQTLSDAPSASRQAAVLLDRIKLTQATFECAAQTQQRCEERLRQVDTEFAELNKKIKQLMAQRAQEERRWHAADRGLAQLSKLSSRLTPAPAEAETEAALKADAGTDAAEGRRDREAIAAVQQRFVAHQAEVAHAFGPSAGTALKDALHPLTLRVSSAASPTPLPAHRVLEIVTRALADITPNADQAARILNALSGRSVTHWVELAAPPENPNPAAPDPLSRDSIAFCRKLATLPRGVDLLYLLSSDGAAPPDAPRAQALRVFWNAEQAQRGEPHAAVRAWLQQAKQVARAKVAADTTTEFDEVDHAAYNAVRNGYLSTLPGTAYDQHNRRLHKAIVEWVIRAAASGSAASAAESPAAAHWRRLAPNLNKTPFGRRTLNRGYAVGESMGLESPRKQVDRAVMRRIAVLEGIIVAALAHGSTPEAKAEAVAAQAVVEHLKQLEQKGSHLSQVTLRPLDAQRIRRRLASEAHQRRLTHASSAASEAGTAQPPALLRKPAPVELPKFLTELCQTEPAAYAALNRIEEHLRATAAWPDEAAGDTDADSLDEDLTAAIRLLKAQHLGHRDDIITLFKPFILGSRLRDRIRLGGGGILGLGLPNLPYGSASPIASPIFTAEVSRGDEAFVQLFMPILGMELSFGRARTHAQEATVGVAVGPQVAPGVSLQGTFTARMAHQRTRTESTLIRFLRRRHQDDEMRANMLHALVSMVQWDLHVPQQGRAYNGPLEAIFGRNPAVVISQLEGVTDTTTLTARVSARLPFTRFNEAHGVAQTLSIEPSLLAEAERVRDRRTEHGGQVRVVGSRSDTAQQRAAATLNANLAPISMQPVPLGVDANGEAHAGEIQRESLPLQLGITRDLAWAMERHEISPFLIDDKQDADLDRHYSTPVDMLAEIAGNREAWLMRCVETLEPDSQGEKDNPDNRTRAAILLDQFEQDIEKLGKTSRYCQYNVNYSMKGAAGANIDGYRALGELARQRGDREEMRRAQQAIDEILLMRGTWRPLMLIVRERARDSTTYGWRSLVRWQRVFNVDGQRTAVQFPPP
jgi:hypothetical protein